MRVMECYSFSLVGSQNNRCVRASPEHLLPVFVVVCVGMGGVYGE